MLEFEVLLYVPKVSQVKEEGRERGFCAEQEIGRGSPGKATLRPLWGVVQLSAVGGETRFSWVLEPSLNSKLQWIFKLVYLGLLTWTHSR